MADTDESQAGDAAEAFEHLTQEVTVLQAHGGGARRCDPVKESPDYSSTLGEIAQGISDRSAAA